MIDSDSDRIAIAHRYDRADPGQCREREKSQDEPEEGEKGMRLMRSCISSNIFLRNEEGEDEEDRLDA